MDSTVLRIIEQMDSVVYRKKEERLRLIRDFDDVTLASICKRYNIKSFASIIDALLISTNDAEVRAHLLGFDSRAEQIETIEKIRKKMRREI